MGDNLNHCPFCGGDDTEYESVRGEELCLVRCNQCNARGPVEGICENGETWNTRACSPVTDEWISVKDRLPEYTAHASGVPFAIVIACGDWDPSEHMYAGGKWTHHTGIEVHVSHWMPMPKPPRAAMEAGDE